LMLTNAQTGEGLAATCHSLHSRLRSITHAAIQITVTTATSCPRTHLWWFVGCRRHALGRSSCALHRKFSRASLECRQNGTLTSTPSFQGRWRRKRRGRGGCLARTRKP
jgi:hypothetical protein